MKTMFIYSARALIKSKKCYYCIIFSIVAAFLLEFFLLKGEKYLFEVGTSAYGFFFHSLENSNYLNLFLVTLPLLCVLPFGDVYFKQKEFISQILTRTSKAKFLLVNCFLSFITGFVFIFIFLGFAYFLNCLLLRTSLENPFYYLQSTFVENNISTVSNYPLFTELILEKPHLYNLVYILMISLYAGLLSMTTFSITLGVNNKIIAYITTFALSIISVPLTLFLPSQFDHWPPHIIFSPGARVDYGVFAIFFWVCLFLTICISFNIYRYRKDVL